MWMRERFSCVLFLFSFYCYSQLDEVIDDDDYDDDVDYDDDDDDDDGDDGDYDDETV
jgi:hypothetical protein